jgi:hypothetical protein
MVLHVGIDKCGFRGIITINLMLSGNKNQELGLLFDPTPASEIDCRLCLTKIPRPVKRPE